MSIIIRIYAKDPNGIIEDAETEFELDSFAGIVPAVGDKILNPLVLQGLDRSERLAREILTVEERIFNPRDLRDYIVLVCRVEPVSEVFQEIIPRA